MLSLFLVASNADTCIIHKSKNNMRGRTRFSISPGAMLRLSLLLRVIFPFSLFGSHLWVLPKGKMAAIFFLVPPSSRASDQPPRLARTAKNALANKY